MSGITSGYLSRTFTETGGAGKIAGIGGGSKTGKSRGCIPEQVHNNSFEMFSNDSPENNLEGRTKGGHNNNTGRQVHNPERVNHSTHSNSRENMEEGE